MTTNYGKNVLNLVGFLKTLVLDILIYKETVYSEQHNDDVWLEWEYTVYLGNKKYTKINNILWPLKIGSRDQE